MYLLFFFLGFQYAFLSFYSIIIIECMENFYSIFIRTMFYMACTLTYPAIKPNNQVEIITFSTSFWIIFLLLKLSVNIWCCFLNKGGKSARKATQQAVSNQWDFWSTSKITFWLIDSPTSGKRRDSHQQRWTNNRAQDWSTGKGWQRGCGVPFSSPPEVVEFSFSLFLECKTSWFPYVRN